MPSLAKLIATIVFLGPVALPALAEPPPVASETADPELGRILDEVMQAGSWTWRVLPRVHVGDTPIIHAFFAIPSEAKLSFENTLFLGMSTDPSSPVRHDGASLGMEPGSGAGVAQAFSAATQIGPMPVRAVAHIGVGRPAQSRPDAGVPWHSSEFERVIEVVPDDVPLVTQSIAPEDRPDVKVWRLSATRSAGVRALSLSIELNRIPIDCVFETEYRWMGRDGVRRSFIAPGPTWKAGSIHAASTTQKVPGFDAELCDITLRPNLHLAEEQAYPHIWGEPIELKYVKAEYLGTDSPDAVTADSLRNSLEPSYFGVHRRADGQIEFVHGVKVRPPWVEYDIAYVPTIQWRDAYGTQHEYSTQGFAIQGRSSSLYVPHKVTDAAACASLPEADTVDITFSPDPEVPRRRGLSGEWDFRNLPKEPLVFKNVKVHRSDKPLVGERVQPADRR